MAPPKKQEECPSGGPGWLATYADMVTLLLTFFVLMMAMANFEDTQRVEQVIESLQTDFGMSGFYQDNTHTHDEKAYTEPIRRRQALQPTVARLRAAMSRHLSDDVIRISQTPSEVRFRLDDRVFFAPGSAELHPSSYALLADLSLVLATEDVQVRVEGHTDASGNEEANWRLSSDRALAVVLAMRDKGPVPGERLEAVGLGSFHVASEFGETDEWNRRVELVLRADQAGAAAAIRELELHGDE